MPVEDRQGLRDQLVVLDIPEHMHPGIEAYIFDHQMPGSFLRAIFENNLRDAVNRADDEDSKLLKAYTTMVYWYAPCQCHGSAEKVETWASTQQEGPSTPQSTLEDGQNG